MFTGKVTAIVQFYEKARNYKYYDTHVCRIQQESVLCNGKIILTTKSEYYLKLYCRHTFQGEVVK